MEPSDSPPVLGSSVGPANPREASFESLARLARQHFGVTGVVIWSAEPAGYRLKGLAGQISGGADLGRELARLFSDNKTLLIVPDTAQESRLAGFTWFNGPGAWRFLAVRALASQAEFSAGGGLALLDYSPRAFGPDDYIALGDYAQLAEVLLANLQVEEETKRSLAKAAELNEMRTQVITLISHEFRTPLSAILSTSELLQYYEAMWTPEKKQELYRRIQVSVRHMTQMLDDILLIGRAEAGKLEFKPEWLDLPKLCQGLVEQVQLEAEVTGKLEFRCITQHPLAQVDQKLFRQILLNLLSNAVKFSRGDQVAQVSLEMDLARRQAILQVSDQGMGIPPEDLPHLFEIFHRASNAGSIGGTGLGLAIAKRSAEKHGGNIEVKSELGKGTTFTVTLPI